MGTGEVWYMVSHYTYEIYPVEVVRTTARFAITREGRLSLACRDYGLFRTKREAIEYATHRLQGDIRIYERRLAEALEVQQRLHQELAEETKEVECP